MGGGASERAKESFSMLRFPTLAPFLFLLTSVLGACASPPPADVRTATVEGRDLSYRVLGSGEPVLVMISGLGDGMDTFADVAPELAQHATIIIYDRAGYGGSAAATDTRDAAAADRELSALLAQSGVRGPYFVLGHSLGGQFAEYFASRHADDVEGLILEDARPADFTRVCEAAAIDMCAAPAALMLLAPQGAQDEFAALAAAAQQVEASAPTPRPTLVMSRSVSATPSTWDALWADSQTGLTARFANARHVVAPRGGHYVHADAQDWFVSTVTAFITQPRAARPE
jgi:pimeloyl-ACP methyl ester carboxylesterase